MKILIFYLSFALLFTFSLSDGEDDHNQVLQLLENPSPGNAAKLAAIFSCNVVMLVNDVRVPNTTTTQFCTEDYWNQHFEDVTLTNINVVEFDDEGNGQFFSRITCTATNNTNGQSSDIEIFEWWLEDDNGKVVYWNRWDGTELLKQFYHGGVGTRPASTYQEVLEHLEGGQEENAILLASLYTKDVVVVLNGKVLPPEETSQYSTVEYWMGFFSIVDISNTKLVDFDDLGGGQYKAKMTCNVLNKMNGNSAKVTLTEWWLEDTNGKVVFWDREEQGDILDQFYSTGIDELKSAGYANALSLLESEDAKTMSNLFSCNVVVVVNDQQLPSSESSQYCTEKYWTKQFNEFQISETDILEFDDLGGGQYAARMTSQVTNLKNNQSAEIELFEWWLEDEGKIVYWNRFDDSDLLKKFHDVGTSKPRRNLMCKNKEGWRYLQ